ncbi:MAG: prepilin-type N-terminal cleavage/methylation domain-containing protein [Phycisphaerales bacterium]|nr:prepilin-type N-terminal cleavage/methylation domain-containing protein [Phycisphaerales bacterium]
MIRRRDPTRSAPRSGATRVGPRAFTLLESLYASAILAIISLATIQSVTAGQQQAAAAQNQLLAVMVADASMSELAVMTYDDLPFQDGATDAVGSLATLSGQPYPASVSQLGQAITVVADTVEFKSPPVVIGGYTATVEVFDQKHALVSLSRFFPEPAE